MQERQDVAETEKRAVGAAGERSGWQADDERNRALYRSLVARHGISAKSLNWGSATSQRLRFEVLAGLGIAPDTSVLDVGCGTGDLLPFLREHGFAGRYTGIDLTPEMVDVARGRKLDGTFITGNVLDMGPAELDPLRSACVLSSGIFYFRREGAAEFMEAMISRLLELATVAVAFNSLSTWADAPAPADEYRADPLATLAYCRSLSPWVTLRHDYHPGDFTIYLRREKWQAPDAAVAGMPT